MDTHSHVHVCTHTYQLQKHTKQYTHIHRESLIPPSPHQPSQVPLATWIIIPCLWCPRHNVSGRYTPDSEEAEDAPAPNVNTSNSVCADGWGLPPASGRETGMGPVYSYIGYALNMGMGLPGGPKAGHIHGAVRAGREGSQSGVRGEDWVASVPHKRPAKCH